MEDFTCKLPAIIEPIDERFKAYRWEWSSLTISASGLKLGKSVLTRESIREVRETCGCLFLKTDAVTFALRIASPVGVAPSEAVTYIVSELLSAMSKGDLERETSIALQLSKVVEDYNAFMLGGVIAMLATGVTIGLYFAWDGGAVAGYAVLGTLLLVAELRARRVARAIYEGA